MEAFKQVINKDLDEEKFSDLYAQTIVYGLFAARIHDESPETFTRDEARKLIPKTNLLCMPRIWVQRYRKKMISTNKK
jgi:hypothetical protein